MIGLHGEVHSVVPPTLESASPRRLHVAGAADPERMTPESLARHGALRWGPARQTLVLSMLHNPSYAGAYVFGRHEDRLGLVEGERRQHESPSTRTPPLRAPLPLPSTRPADAGFPLEPQAQRT